MNAKTGDFAEVTTADEKIEGLLLQSPEKDLVVLKLNSGYNLGIERKKIKKIEAKTQTKTKTATPLKVKADSALPKITILHTGGTIASKVDYKTGGVVSRFTADEILALFPELNKVAQIESRMIGNMFSEDMRFAHFNIIAKEIAKEAGKGVKGVIITHGTDTMAYSSAALSFILENIGIPVIMVGAQRSSDRGSSDAGANLLSAAYFIANSSFAGVGICMHENMNDEDCLILPGLKTRKMHTSRRDAFRPINSKPIARVNFSEKKIAIIQDFKSSQGRLEVKPIKETLKVGLLKAHPNLYAAEILAYDKFDGLLIEGTGLGQISVTELDEHTKENSKILAAVKKLASQMPVAMASQTIYGRIQMNVYSSARDLQEAGVIGNYHDMTPETAYIKLAWLLSNYTKKEAKELFAKNLRGEISERTENNFLN